MFSTTCIISTLTFNIYKWLAPTSMHKLMPTPLPGKICAVCTFWKAIWRELAGSVIETQISVFLLSNSRTVLQGPFCTSWKKRIVSVCFTLIYVCSIQYKMHRVNVIMSCLKSYIEESKLMTAILLSKSCKVLSCPLRQALQIGPDSSSSHKLMYALLLSKSCTELSCMFWQVI